MVEHPAKARNDKNHGRFRRVVGVLLGALGLAAIFRFGRGRASGPEQPAATPPTPSQKAPDESVPIHEEEEIRYPDGRIEHPAVQREPRDVPFRWVIAVLLAAACIAVFHYYIIWRYFGWERAAEARSGASPYPLAPTPSTTLPRGPRLEELNRIAGQESLLAREAAQEKTLHSYGPSDEKGYVHIPIQEAMKHAAERLPARKPAQGRAAKDNGLVDSGESNSGRMFRGPSP